jgi:hypothetical protein
MKFQNRLAKQFLRIAAVVCWFSTSAESQQQTIAVPIGHSSALFLLTPRDSVLQLPAEFLIAGSESVWLDSVQQLRNGVDYSVDYRFGRVRFQREPFQRFISDPTQHGILVIFRSLPLAFKPEYFLNRTVLRRDTARASPTTFVAPVQAPHVDDLFGPGLQKSGSLARGFAVGTNRDLSLSSGFRMQLAGNLSRDVGVVAALTDENTPIQPEGTTQSLREVDNVFVQLKSPSYAATLGDFTYELQGTEGGEFARLSRKLQGATGTLSFLGTPKGEGGTSLMLTGATQRGKYNNTQLQGIEGNQGPYQLTGKNGERRIVIVAGSERVFVNGETMTRGETNDYTIDYGSGELFFMSRRMITNASRITVDYEYTDQQYARNFMGGGISSNLMEGRLKMNALFLQEADDPDSPLGSSLDDRSRSILSSSGADRLKASLPSTRNVGRDSVTNAALGQYVLRDTVISGKTYHFFLYAPGDPQALYSATFSIVSRMPEDSAGYVRDGIGSFRFVGIGQGNYLPIQLLPLPQLQRMVDLNGSATLGTNLSVSAEYARSQVDQNRLSSLDDQDQGGNAMKLGMRFHPENITLGMTNLGGVDLSLSERYVDHRFVSFDRYNDVEFNRSWNVESASAGDEEIREAMLAWRPRHGVEIAGRYGLLNREGVYRTSRVQTNMSLKDSALNGFQFHREDLRSTDFLTQDNSEWTREKGTASYILWKLQPGIRVESEHRTLSSSTNDSLRFGSFRFLEVAPSLASLNQSGFQATAEFQFRTEDSVATGALQRASDSFTQVYSASYRPTSAFYSQLSLNMRRTTFTSLFKQRGNTDADVVLVRSQTFYAPLERAFDGSVLYEFSNQRAARLERVFLRVPKGTGNYRYKGDLNGNGVPEDDEFELTRFDGDYVVIYAPGDQLFPVLDLKTAFRLRMEPSRILRQPSSAVERFLNAFSTETVIRIEEKSTESDTKEIYLLKLSRFQNDKTTIAGSRSFSNDLYLFEHRADFSARFRYSERTSLVQLLSATEKSYGLERSIRVRTQLVQEIGNETDIVNKVDRVLASSATTRERDVLANSLSSDFSYRPEPAWELGFRFAVSRNIDRLRLPNPTADINELSVRTSYALFGTGQVRAELRREEVALSQGVVDSQRPFPFEFTSGKVIGRTMLWHLAFEYRFNQNIQVTLQYDGRNEAGHPTVHLGQVEAKMFF